MQNENFNTDIIDKKTILRPTTIPPNQTNPTCKERYFFGRKVLYADYNEEQLNETVIAQILEQVWHLHLENSSEIDYLEKYYRGCQPILGKTKDVRPTINNIVVEPNAFSAVNFKTGFVFGDPIQYVQRGEVAKEEVSVLNGYVLAEDKYAKDSENAESLYTSGIAHRMVLPHYDEDSPFLIENLDSKTTFCVYSSGIGHKKLFGATYTRNIHDSNISGSIYTRNGFYKFDISSLGTTFNVNFVTNHYLGMIPIFEYYLNKWRLGIIEVVMSIFNAANRISSGDLDGLEQYVQSILVFVNQDVTKEDYLDIIDIGAAMITSVDSSRPADLKLLQNELSHSNTQILHDRLIEIGMTSIGIPTMKSKTSGGDTGQARELGDGWEMANARANQEEMSYKKCSKDEIKLILRICRMTPDSGITTLTVKDIEQKFPRKKHANFLVKTQGLMNMIQAGVSPDVAFASCDIFSDSNEAYQSSIDFYGGVENWTKCFITKSLKEVTQEIEEPNIKEEDDLVKDPPSNLEN